MYALRGDVLFVNLYAAGTAEIKMADGRAIEMTQETRYPWDGNVRLIVHPQRAGNLTINVRVPGWARDEVVPSDLYRYVGEIPEKVTITVNRHAVPLKVDKGYVSLTRNWRSGDVIELNLPMPVRRVIANKNVEADRVRVAVQRGPIVYCAEWPDNPAGKVLELALHDNTPLHTEFRPDLLNGLTVVKGTGLYVPQGGAENGTEKPVEFTLIPYYAWAHRGKGQMTVWMQRGNPGPKTQPPKGSIGAV
jgi:hypothetical protein